jgi:hypothetical protein
MCPIRYLRRPRGCCEVCPRDRSKLREPSCRGAWTRIILARLMPAARRRRGASAQQAPPWAPRARAQPCRGKAAQQCERRERGRHRSARLLARRLRFYTRDIIRYDEACVYRTKFSTGYASTRLACCRLEYGKFTPTSRSTRGIRVLEYLVSWRRSETQYLLMRVEVEGNPIPKCSRPHKVGGHFRFRKIPTY